jgi:hypothetical protein
VQSEPDGLAETSRGPRARFTPASLGTARFHYCHRPRGRRYRKPSHTHEEGDAVALVSQGGVCEQGGAHASLRASKGRNVDPRDGAHQGRGQAMAHCTSLSRSLSVASAHLARCSRRYLRMPRVHPSCTDHQRRGTTCVARWSLGPGESVTVAKRDLRVPRRRHCSRERLRVHTPSHCRGFAVSRLAVSRLAVSSLARPPPRLLSACEARAMPAARRAAD